MQHSLSLFLACAALMLLCQACIPTLTQTTLEAKVITVIVQVTQPAPENTPVSQPAPANTQETQPEQQPTSQPQNPASGPECTALQNINFRVGPGRIFDPPFNVIRKGSSVIPDGFAPLGFPDGSWIHIINPATNENGWISADPQLASCTVDITSLPLVQAPPTPALVRLRSSKPEGTPNGISGTPRLSPNDLIRFEAIGPGGEKDGDHIKEVRFIIHDEFGETTLYDHTEQSAPYCIFGGDQGCNPWPKRDGKYIWGEQGDWVQSGASYQVDILAATDDDSSENQFGNWSFTLTVDLP